jgi:glycosyltransferase involved in cell wall biosynthesis
MATPAVSVIIPVYNGERFLREAIESVLAQTFRSYEIVCVDDGSTDGSKNILKEYATRLRVIEQANAGQSAARNVSAMQSRGAYLAFLDQDDCWYPDKLSRQVAVLDRQPDVVVVHCNVDTMDEDGRTMRVGQTVADLTSSLDSPLGRLIEEPLILPSAMMVRRECFERAGMFDSELRGFEDYDLVARLKRHGRCVLIEESGLRYRVHENGFNRAWGLRIIRSRERFLLRMKRVYAGMPKKQSLVSLMLGECYSDWGKALLQEHRAREARAMFVKSLKADPLKFRTWSRLIRSFTSAGTTGATSKSSCD